MIVKMKKNVSQKEIDKLKKFVEEKGLEIKDISSSTLIVFGLIGDTSAFDPRDIQVFDGVEQVTRLTTPFKKASRSMKQEDTVIYLNNGLKIGGGDFIVMAGPCSVESAEQLDIIASEIKKSGAHVLRGGAYKPRTSPYAFQGMGVDGLKLLRETADKYGLLVVSEMMSIETFDEFETYVDIIQVGARNMQNFDLLKKLGHSKKPILLKRGLSATIEEWLMSAEYIMAHGNEQVILCERGIRTFEKYTRNTLDISAVLAVRELSHLPVIVDPSHAAGRYSMIEDLSLASLAVKADGVIVEVHHEPEKAFSDGAQSLKPQKFDHMMQRIKALAKYFDKEIK